MNTYQPLKRAELAKALSAVDQARVALIGDLCLDLYWTADMRLSELSRETPHHPLPVVNERFSAGGAGNVACNMAALNPKQLTVIGAIGCDWRGDLLLKALQDFGIDDSFIARDASLVTNTYIKPLRKGISDVVYEDARIDFENRTPLPETVERRLLDLLEKAMDRFDVLCVSDQMRYGVVTPAVRKRLCELSREGKTVIVDSRDHIADYRNVIIKPNEIEAARAFGGDGSMDSIVERMGQVCERNGASAVVTLGDRGCIVFEGAAEHCAARAVKPPVDFVGAGDTFLSALGCMVAAGAPLFTAARAATIASSVTIQKIGTTGTASRAEMIENACEE